MLIRFWNRCLFQQGPRFGGTWRYALFLGHVKKEKKLSKEIFMRVLRDM
jgi:hypothetical protein